MKKGFLIAMTLLGAGPAPLGAAPAAAVLNRSGMPWTLVARHTTHALHVDLGDHGILTCEPFRPHQGFFSFAIPAGACAEIQFDQIREPFSASAAFYLVDHQGKVGLAKASARDPRFVMATYGLGAAVLAEERMDRGDSRPLEGTLAASGRHHRDFFVSGHSAGLGAWLEIRRDAFGDSLCVPFENREEHCRDLVEDVVQRWEDALDAPAAGPASPPRPASPHPASPRPASPRPPSSGPTERTCFF